jgi:hypothetical protein
MSIIKAIDDLIDNVEDLLGGCGIFSPVSTAMEYNPSLSSIGDYDVSHEGDSVWLKVCIDSGDAHTRSIENCLLVFKETFPGYINYFVGIQEINGIHVITFSFDL